MKRRSLSRRECLAALLTTCSVPTFLRAAERAGRGDVPWLADVQRPPDRLPDDAPRLSPLLVDDEGREITTLDAWERKRRAIRHWVARFPGAAKRSSTRPASLATPGNHRTP